MSRQSNDNAASPTTPDNALGSPTLKIESGILWPLRNRFRKV